MENYGIWILLEHSNDPSDHLSLTSILFIIYLWEFKTTWSMMYRRMRQRHVALGIVQKSWMWLQSITVVVWAWCDMVWYDYNINKESCLPKLVQVSLKRKFICHSTKQLISRNQGYVRKNWFCAFSTHCAITITCYRRICIFERKNEKKHRSLIRIPWNIFSSHKSDLWWIPVHFSLPLTSATFPNSRWVLTTFGCQCKWRIETAAWWVTPFRVS